MRWTLVFCLLLLSCKDRSGHQLKSSPPANSISWINKLRYVTNGFKQPDIDSFFSAEDYVDIPAEEVVAEFMQSPAFAATLLQFHLYYHEALTDKVRSTGIERLLNNPTSGVLFEYPATQTASFELMRGKDYLGKLWSWEHKVVSQPTTVSQFFDSFSRLASIPREALTRDGFFRRFRDRTTVTNFHRARSASVLKSYFCDELTLDKAVLDELIKGLAANHTQSQGHASPTCMSCHFRLDPIGAYFRYYNADGSYWNAAQIVLANGSIGADDPKYLREWEDAEGNTVAGYALSPQELVSHGDDLPSLFQVIADPRVRRTRECLVKRATQFFTSSRQLYDVEWLSDLAGEFDRHPADSSTAMRTILTRIFTSETFKQESPEFNRCYDQKDQRPDAPPCELRYLTNEYCVKCHNSGDPIMDMTKWVRGPDGKAMFAHDSSKSRNEMIDWILDALDGKNGVQKMPLENNLPLDHKQALVNELLNIKNKP
jgi:hypothetical protein